MFIANKNKPFFRKKQTKPSAQREISSVADVPFVLQFTVAFLKFSLSLHLPLNILFQWLKQRMKVQTSVHVCLQNILTVFVTALCLMFCATKHRPKYPSNLSHSLDCMQLLLQPQHYCPHPLPSIWTWGVRTKTTSYNNLPDEMRKAANWPSNRIH